VLHVCQQKLHHFRLYYYANYCDLSVCVSMLSLYVVYIKNCHSKFREMLCTCYLWRNVFAMGVTVLESVVVYNGSKLRVGGEVTWSYRLPCC